MKLRSFALLLILGLAASTAACTPKTTGPQGPTRPLSSWAGEEAQLFADSMDVGALPPNVVASDRDEENEAKIPRRLDLADGVIGAHVVGVNQETRGDKVVFRVDFAVDGEAYAGAKLDSPFTLLIAPETGPYAAFKSAGDKLIGRKVVVFYKRYAPVEEGDEAITHFHIAPATPAVLKAIDTAKTRKEFH